MSLSKTMVTLYAVCIQLQGADTYYQELEDKVIGRKDRLPMNMHAHTHTHTQNAVAFLTLPLSQ